MDKCAVYHWWGEDFPPYSNLRVPLVVSIATLRAVSDVPIIVLNCSNNPDRQNWLHFPDKLKFEIRNIRPSLEPYKELVPGWMYLSRFFDLEKHIKQKTVMYVDTDVFWFKDPFPLNQNPNKMCVSPYNSGFFYYNSDSPDVHQFFELFKTYAKAAIHSQAVRDLFKKYISWDGWYGVWDEMVLCFMHNQNRELINELTIEEHALTSQIDYNIKMIHANGLSVTNKVPKNEDEKHHSRGLLGITINELYQNIRTVLNEEDIGLIYTKEQLDTYLPLKFDLFRNLHKIDKSKNTAGHFDFSKCLMPQMPFI